MRLRLDYAFCTRYTSTTAFVNFYCGADCAGNCLKSAFDFVVITASADYIDVEVAAGGVYKALPEIFEAVGLEGAFFSILN